jgi:lysozyme
MLSDLIREIKKEEGFRAQKYKDTLGFETVGYGTKLPLNEIEKRLVKDPENLTEREADKLLQLRLESAMRELNEAKPIVRILSSNRKVVIYNMLYQLGFNGILKFKKMWLAIENGDYGGAADEMKDSRWYLQTPARAKRLINKMLEG